MKTFISILILLAVFTLNNYSAHAQIPNWLWAQQAGGTDSDFGIGIATDGSGNSIVTGGFTGTATFGDTTLTSAGSADIFVAKYDSDGNFLWVQQAGGTGSDWGLDIATDGSGNSIVTGFFDGTATFGDTTLTSAGGENIFVAKYDSDGILLWAQQASGNWGLGIATDGSGNSIITGFFDGTATFGDTTLTSAGDVDIFVAKYDSDGNLLWAQQAGGTDFDIGYGISTDGSGNSIITGFFFFTATFGDTMLTSAGGRDIFVAKYDSEGNLLWVQQAGGTGSGSGRGNAIDGSGNSIVTGFFEGTATFGDTTLTSAGDRDFFVAKYDSDGNVLWVQQASSDFGDESEDDFSRGIATDGSGNSIITGFFQGTATFGDTTLTSAGSADIFVAKYDSDGNFLWVQQAGETEGSGFGIATDGSGNSIVTGGFRGIATFGDNMLTSAGSFDIFVAKLGPRVTGIEEEFALPRSFNLSQSYPNPFNPSTTIRYSLPRASHVLLSIYNILGQEVRTLVNEKQTPGHKSVVWNGRDRFGKEVSSGVYIYRIQAGDYSKSRKMVLLR